MEALNIPAETEEKISEVIGSDQSVVGIDAKKTHILILHLLLKLEERLTHIEDRISKLERP